MMQPDFFDCGTREDFTVEKFRMAKQFIMDARDAHQRESNNTSVNRSYYALFKIVTALQTLDNKTFKSHGQAIGDFNYEYIHHRKIFPEEYGAKLYDVMRLRHKSDYEDFMTPTDDETRDAITFAETFFVSVKQYCEQLMGKEIPVKLENNTV